jgi:GAF domain-containing protein
MTLASERRTKHRRFSDRRVAVMLAVHELLFDLPPGAEREEEILEVLRDDFGSDRAALVAPFDGAEPGLVVNAASGSWSDGPRGRRLTGRGLGHLLEVHRLAAGAVTLTYVRRPPAFDSDGWEDLFNRDLLEPTSALLSVELHPRSAPRSFLWLQQETGSREWSSKDRELAEEVAHLLARAADKAIGEA